MADCLPALLGDRRDLDFDLIHSRPAYQSIHGSRLDLQIEYAATSYVGATAWESIGIVAVALEVLAPGLSPKRICDPSAVNDDWRLIPKFRRCPLRFPAAFLN